MARTVLITGGAGFIGSHLTDQLLDAGYSVRILDNLSKQVHGTRRRRPAYLRSDAELIVGDVRDADAVRRALHGVDRVCHLAAAVGVGQSMYQIDEYTSVNNLGTATLLQALIERPVERLVVASSMSIYGEGSYRTSAGQLATPVPRSAAQLKAKAWEVRDASGETLTPVPTPETKPPLLGSVYALSKYDQERLCWMVGEAYGIPTIALRFFNVYGPRQALSNPYTGVLAIFAARMLNGNRPLIFEDGCQQRDFVSVHDVARACCTALEAVPECKAVLNVGSGQAYRVSEIAERLAAVMGRQNLTPELTGTYRVGDIRHCFADIQLARELLAYAPRVSLEAGLVELAHWLEHEVATDQVSQAHAELAARGLTI
ncbi:MAG TPA: SDR family NAD(P)-dependent oxidoreductase [Polyangiales bacterium]|nr:SDR family NAD(P)-dependent oxidoreductase [Polyangiales bacterium]